MSLKTLIQSINPALVDTTSMKTTTDAAGVLDSHTNSSFDALAVNAEAAKKIQQILTSVRDKVVLQYKALIDHTALRQQRLLEVVEHVNQFLSSKPEIYYIRHVFKSLPAYQDKLQRLQQRIDTITKKCIKLDEKLNNLRRKLPGKYVMKEPGTFYYQVVYKGGINVRTEPRVHAQVTGDTLIYQDIVQVDERIAFTGSDFIFLRLASGRGWVFERTTDKQIMQRISARRAARLFKAQLTRNGGVSSTDARVTDVADVTDDGSEGSNDNSHNSDSEEPEGSDSDSDLPVSSLVTVEDSPLVDVPFLANDRTESGRTTI